ncbi:hypothetical protein ACCC92_06165 [Mucilaginibacter sp. Mucisp84]|uniref:hypothetical protein n=1 Tax=Mucilaginibacter sp. Mucisp84 TaxID=3243058 RepID=UPI0039A48C85
MLKKNILLVICVLMANFLFAQTTFQTKWLKININKSGFVTNVLAIQSQKEYSPKRYTSPFMSLYAGKEKTYEPVSFSYNQQNRRIKLVFSNGSTASVEVTDKKDYLRFTLLSLTKRSNITNIVWGPYKTTISKYIGDMLGVVHDGNFAFGIFSLKDNTTGGLPCEGDLSQGYYYIHTNDPVANPLPAGLHEGQRFRFGGDGINDIAMSSQAEDYYKTNSGIAAQLAPDYGSYVALQSRDRRMRHLDFITLLPGYERMNLPRHQWVDAIPVDFIGSSVAMYACPDTAVIAMLKKITKSEKLPYITTLDNKWIRDPKSFKADLAWNGRQDSLVSYARQLGVYSVQDEGFGEYYPNPADRWGSKRIMVNHQKISVADFTKQTNAHNIAYGLHTLCEFLQPNCSDVSPVPSDSLETLYSTWLAKGISAADTIIRVTDTTFLNEYGGWEGNHTNVLKLGKELIEYNGVTTTQPYTLLHVKRGFYNTHTAAHSAGERIDKLQPNCYHGFAPNIALQDKYAEYYAKFLVDGGMNYIDFDGLESCAYQAQGTYSEKRFYRKLFDAYHRLGGKYLRVMGSGISEGGWLFMSTNNVGGDSNMYNPVTDAWGIEGKDIRNGSQSNYLPCTFGIQNFSSSWTYLQADNLQSRAIGWDAMFMLGLNESNVEKCKDKSAFFATFSAWEHARNAGVFSSAMKKELRNPDKRWHLTEVKKNTWSLQETDARGNKAGEAITLKKDKE